MHAPPRDLIVAALLAIAAGGCGDDQDPEGAAELWDRIHAEDYRSWQRAPGYETRRDSDAPHSEAVDIYVNDVIAGALADEASITAWPTGSLIVKDGFDGELELVAAMEKRQDGWYWAEWDDEGASDYSGKPDVCTGCHQSGADYVRAFGFP
jgi:hypothetical protein